MHEEWREVIEFPGYSVSDAGRIRNEKTGWLMTQLVNQRGIAYSSFNRRGVQFKRSVSILVATAFVTTARPLAWDTPINLDGDRLNNCAANLLWRPRWYATKYFQQFESVPQSINRLVQEVKTGEVFKSSWDAAIAFGLLDSAVVDAITNHTYAVPTFQKFRLYG